MDSLSSDVIGVIKIIVNNSSRKDCLLRLVNKCPNVTFHLIYFIGTTLRFSINCYKFSNRYELQHNRMVALHVHTYMHTYTH